MADNISVTEGTGKVIATDDVGGTQYQRIKLTLGADGVSDGDVSSSNPIPISAAALPLPSGAATSGLQTTGNSSLSSIDIKTAPLGQTTMAASSPVTIASNQSALAISAASLPLPTGATTLTEQQSQTTSLQLIDNVIGAVVAGTAGTNSALIGGQFNTTLPTLTNTQQAAAQFDSNGRLLVSDASVDGYKKTYLASIVGLVPPATPTDIFTITGSATTTVRITRIFLTGTQTTAAQRDILLIKRSTANTAGTSTAPTRIPLDANDAAATATVLAYTANPTLGTGIGTLYSRKMQISTVSLLGDTLELAFGAESGKCVVLRGIAQVLAVNLNSVTSAGNLFNVTVEWTEE